MPGTSLLIARFNSKAPCHNGVALLGAIDDDDTKDTTASSLQEENVVKRSPSGETLESKIAKESATSSQTSTNPPFSFSLAALATLAFVLFWPLLAFLRSSSFDVDMFMALKGILQDPGVLPKDTPEVLELPPLSPAEQLVGAIFRPPVR